MRREKPGGPDCRGQGLFEEIGTTTNGHHDHGNASGRQDAGIPRVAGFAAAPVGRRRPWMVIVPRCLHTHRANGNHGGIRTGSCGKVYRVVLAGNKRARWSA